MMASDGPVCPMIFYFHMSAWSSAPRSERRSARGHATAGDAFQDAMSNPPRSEGSKQ